MKKETTELRVKPLLPPPEKKKLSFKVPAPTVESFETYLAAYAEIYGVEANRDFVANEILTTFFESDKAFASYLNHKKNSAPAGKDEESGRTEKNIRE